MRKISADIVFPIDRSPILNGVVSVDQQGKILSIEESHDPNAKDVEIHEGWLIPGFVNTHCHLELSHMKNMVDTGTGLIPFISSVVKYRDIEQSVIDDAIKRADEEMIKEGIVAVGDISNKADTASVKSSSSISYYTFVEMFDFMQEGMTQSTIDQYTPVLDQQSDQGRNKKNFVPHAPYTVSEKLFSFINNNCKEGCTVSIHNQETHDENLLFQTKEGKFISFFEEFGMSMDGFEPIGNGSIHYAMNNMDPDQKTLFVHNTMTSASDIQKAHAWNDKVYWATCANANLYIENRLPRYQTFIDEGARMTIGTDSLTSNWQLSILEEIKTIRRFQSHVPVESLLKWATVNGAEALGYDEDLGTITVGKTPGLNLIQNADFNTGVMEDAVVKKLL